MKEMIDLQRLNELHAAVVTEVGRDCDDVTIALEYDQFCVRVYSAWPAVSARLALLEEFVARVSLHSDLSGSTRRELDRLDADTATSCEWIPMSARHPTDSDRDANGYVWAWVPGFGVDQMGGIVSAVTYWKPGRCERPECGPTTKAGG